MMSMLEALAGQVEMTTTMLAFTFETTATDRQTWCPTGEGDARGRSALDQLRECISVNHMVAALIKGEAKPDESTLADLTCEQAVEALKASGTGLAGTIRSMDPADLGKVLDAGFAQMPAARLIGMSVFNQMYHVGQICYIQTLFGDTEFRVAPGIM